MNAADAAGSDLPDADGSVDSQAASTQQSGTNAIIVLFIVLLLQTCSQFDAEINLANFGSR
jgi:hypothetical protein